MNFAGSLLHNMSCPPRTEVVVTQRPVAARHFVFSLSAVIPALKVRNQEHSDRKSIFDFGWEEIPPVEEVEVAVDRLPGFLIGFPDKAEVVRCVKVRSVALVIALLSRRIDGLFIKARTPDYSIGSLLGSPFRVEDWRAQKSTRGAQP